MQELQGSAEFRREQWVGGPVERGGKSCQMHGGKMRRLRGIGDGPDGSPGLPDNCGWELRKGGAGGGGRGRMWTCFWGLESYDEGWRR